MFFFERGGMLKIPRIVCAFSILFLHQSDGFILKNIRSSFLPSIQKQKKGANIRSSTSHRKTVIPKFQLRTNISSKVSCHRNSLRLFSIGPDGDYDEDDEEEAYVAVDFSIFLAQRSIQSFLFLLQQIRDPHTINWIDDFLKPALTIPQNTPMFDDSQLSPDAKDNAWSRSYDYDRKSSALLYYHGLNVFDTEIFDSWDTIFLELLKMPYTRLLIETTSAVTPSFEIDIDPSRLCSRILSVRSQIANEWAYDLNVISNLGERIFSSYWEIVQKGGENEDGYAFERQSQMFLDINPDRYSDLKVSPLRKGNYDLLLLLATHESICRVLNREGGIYLDEGDSDQKMMANKEFLKQFYSERKYKYFYGNGKYGRADSFLSELMLTPMIVKDQDILIDPLGIAEIVVRERERIATEWRNHIVEVVLKGSDQLEVRQLMLDKMMAMNEIDIKEEIRKAESESTESTGESENNGSDKSNIDSSEGFQ